MREAVVALSVIMELLRLSRLPRLVTPVMVDMLRSVQANDLEIRLP